MGYKLPFLFTTIHAFCGQPPFLKNVDFLFLLSKKNETTKTKKKEGNVLKNGKVGIAFLRFSDLLYTEINIYPIAIYFFCVFFRVFFGFTFPWGGWAGGRCETFCKKGTLYPTRGLYFLVFFDGG